MQEVKMDAGLPTGWSGTADMFVWDREQEGFMLVDFKTTKPEGIQWIERDGIKHEHHAQASAYWMAAQNLGLPLVREYAVLYLPTGQLPPNKQQVAPLLLRSTPDPRVWSVMEERWRLTEAYLDETPEAADPQWLTPSLAPVQDRVQKLMRPDRNSGQRDVVLVPEWYAAYCSFPDEICSCRSQGTTKVGHYDSDGNYIPRKGYEDVAPSV